MKIILANPRGFCAGVNMAVSALDKAVERFGTPFYVYHEIVHNNWVVESFRNLGVLFVDSLDVVPPGSRLMFSAHGVSPEIRRQAVLQNLYTIDATCPLVRKVHEEVIGFAKNGYKIILVGHPGHDEIVAVMSEAPDCTYLVATEADVDSLPDFETEKIAYVTQTTLSVDEAGKILGHLSVRFPHIVKPPSNDICYATQNRQDAIKKLAALADVVLVVGSCNSSNSRRLVEIARSITQKSYLIDGKDDIDPCIFAGSETVLVSAGASAPESVVQECVRFLVEKFDAAVEEQIIHKETKRFAAPEELR